MYKMKFKYMQIPGIPFDHIWEKVIFKGANQEELWPSAFWAIKTTYKGKKYGVFMEYGDLYTAKKEFNRMWEKI